MGRGNLWRQYSAGRTLGDDWGARRQPNKPDAYDWRQVLEDKNKSAITESNVITTENMQPHLTQFMMDSVYQTFADNVPGFWDWLANQVPPPNPATPEGVTEAK